MRLLELVDCWITHRTPRLLGWASKIVKKSLHGHVAEQHLCKKTFMGVQLPEDSFSLPVSLGDEHSLDLDCIQT